MLTIKLAFRNITHAGLRTWLNVFILSFAFVLIIWTQGFNDGLGETMLTHTTKSEYGGGQYWQKVYDPYDPLTLDDAHASLTPALNKMVESNLATPILMVSGTIFSDGRIYSARLRGIDPTQEILDIPSKALQNADTLDAFPAFIGSRMAADIGLNQGDYIIIRWRDINGTFDAIDLKIVHIMHTKVPTIDVGQVWISLPKLQSMMQAPNEATIIVLKKNLENIPAGDDQWILKNLDFLTKELRDIVEQKTVSSSIFYAILVGMALLAVFDTQVLAIFRRRKEMGTMMALGMTRGKIIRLFTLEGFLHGVLALAAGAVYGIPLLYYSLKYGLDIPGMSQKSGLAIGSVLYPVYGLKLFIITFSILFISVLVVSYLPTRKITRLKPTDALRGKLS